MLKEYQTRTYDRKLYNELINKKLFDKKPLTQEEEDYITFCYHWEEYQAGLL